MTTVRPLYLNQFIGQNRVIEQLKISILSAKARKDSLGHILLAGYAGLGKTSLATAIANELNTKIIIANAASITSVKTLLPYIASIKHNNILFIDEIHRLSIKLCELLYPVMEDFRIDLSSKEEVYSIPIPRFTLIGATTHIGSIPTPLRDRFKIKQTLDWYTEDELISMIKINSQPLKISLDQKSERLLARMGRGTPRIINSLLEWLRDFSMAIKTHELTEEKTLQALKLFGLDEYGLTEYDRKYLDLLKNKFNGKPVGINTLCAALSLDKETIEEIIEPYLIRIGLVNKTPKGRIYVQKELAVLG